MTTLIEDMTNRRLDWEKRKQKMNLFDLQKLFSDSKLSMESAFKLLMDEYLKQQMMIDELGKQLKEKGDCNDKNNNV